MLSALKAGLLIDGTGATPVRDATLIIEDARIKEIRTGSNFVAPEVKVYDASAYTVIPGLIDTLIHLNYPSVPSLALFRVETPATLGVFYASQAALASLALECAAPD